MKQLLDSGMEIIVESDFIYTPLLFDPEIENEIEPLLNQVKYQEQSISPSPKTIIRRNGSYFVKGLAIHSILENFKAINAYDYDHLRKSCLKKYHLLSERDAVFMDETLHIILFDEIKNFGIKCRDILSFLILDLAMPYVNGFRIREIFIEIDPVQVF